MIPQRNISLIANKITTADRNRIPETVSETICFPLQERPILRQFDEFDDLPDGPMVLSYSLEEVVVEKIDALSKQERASAPPLAAATSSTGKRSTSLRSRIPRG